MKKHIVVCIAAVAAAAVSLPVLANPTWTEGYGVDTSYGGAYDAARAEAANECLGQGGTPGDSTNVIHSGPLGGGYTEVLVERICFHP